MTDDNDSIESVIEGTALVVHTALPDRHFQATVKALKDTDLKDVENINVESPKADQKTAWFALVQYLIRRTNRPEVKQLMEHHLLGSKPRIDKLSNIKWRVHFFEAGTHEAMGSYDITLIEL